MYYSRSQLLSHNKLLNMVISNRGGGKTYNMTCWAIDDFKKTGQQCAWVRRYKTEIDEMILNGKFFDAVREKYKGDKLEIDGNIGYINGEAAIFFIALSTSRQLKSNNYPKVNKIIYDEFILSKGRISYLKNEVEVFLDLIETIARTRDNVRAVLLANAVSVVNPYFMFFNIRVDWSKRFTIKGEICVENFTDETFIENKKKTKFGKLINNTRYGDYAIENKMLEDNNEFIASKTKESNFMMSLTYNKKTYGFWADFRAGYIFVNRQFDPSSTNQYCLLMEDHTPNTLLIKSLSSSYHMQYVVYAFNNGVLRFEDMEVKNQFYEYISMFIR